MNREEKFISITYKSNFNARCRQCGGKDVRIKNKFNYAYCIDCFELPHNRTFYNDLIDIKNRRNRKCIKK